jgi:hypothetical protein
MSNPILYCQSQNIKLRDSSVLGREIGIDDVKDLDDSTLSRFCIELDLYDEELRNEYAESTNVVSKQALTHKRMIWKAFLLQGRIEKETRKLDQGERFYDLVCAKIGSQAAKDLMTEARSVIQP